MSRGGVWNEVRKRRTGSPSFDDPVASNSMIGVRGRHFHSRCVGFEGSREGSREGARQEERQDGDWGTHRDGVDCDVGCMIMQS